MNSNRSNESESLFADMPEFDALVQPIKACRILIHGGAGQMTPQNTPPEELAKYHKGLEDSLKAGWKILSKGGSAVDAVVAAIKSMEDNPVFNAGKGAVFTSEGTNELDAAIMDGKNLDAGAVAGVEHIKNPFY